MAISPEEQDAIDMEKGALKIQSIARGRKARRGDRRPKTPQDPAAAAEENSAAARLQARQRGLLSRRRVTEMKEQRASAEKIQSIHRGREGRRMVQAKKMGGLELESKGELVVRWLFPLCLLFVGFPLTLLPPL